MRINGSTVLVTGASMGIGAATALEFARYQAKVLLTGRSTTALHQIASQIDEIGGESYVYAADISTLAGATRLAAEVKDDHGAPAILVNNAGSGQFKFADQTTPEEFEKMVAMPFLGAGYLTMSLLPAMVQQPAARIVNVNSPVSRVVWPSATGYAASRWGMRGLTEGLRADLRETGVGVTEVIPGRVSSQYFVNNPGSADRLPAIAKVLPTSRPEKVAAKIVRAVACNHDEVVFPFLLKALVTQARLTPRLVSKLITATGAKRSENGATAR